MKGEADVKKQKKKITDDSVMRQEHLSFLIQILPLSTKHSKRNTLDAPDSERILKPFN